MGCLFIRIPQGRLKIKWYGLGWGGVFGGQSCGTKIQEFSSVPFFAVVFPVEVCNKADITWVYNKEEKYLRKL